LNAVCRWGGRSQDDSAYQMDYASTLSLAAEKGFKKGVKKGVKKASG
jgi:hypothetical protein